MPEDALKQRQGAADHERRENPGENGRCRLLGEQTPIHVPELKPGNGDDPKRNGEDPGGQTHIHASTKQAAPLPYLDSHENGNKSTDQTHDQKKSDQRLGTRSNSKG